MDKKVFSAVCLIVGSAIGAGFATGKEIIVFFSKYGMLTLPNSLLFGILFTIMLYVFMMIGKDQKVVGITRATKLVMGKWERACHIFLLLMLTTLIAGMFGGVKELTAILLPNHSMLIYIMFFCLMLVLSFCNMRVLSFINKICVPCIIVYMLSFFFVCPYKNISIVVETSMAKSVLSCIYYVALNVMIAGFVMMSFSHGMTKKQIKLSCILGGGIITLLLLFVSILFLFCGEGVVRSAIPVLTLAYSNSTAYGLLGLGIVFIAILTTLLSNQFCFKNLLLEKNCPKTVASVLPICLGFLLSFIGFEKIIGYCYPIIGCVGEIFSIRLCYRYFTHLHKSRDNVNLYHNIDNNSH